MDFQIDHQDCWRASRGSVHLGATLAEDELEKAGVQLRKVKQVHGGRIVDDEVYGDEPLEADGLITDHGYVALLIRTADCVPVHIIGEKRLGMLHAGWRSVRAGIIGKLNTWFPDGGQAVIGPCISGPVYEVNEDLYGDWVEVEPLVADFLNPSPTSQTHRYFDLGGLVNRQLVDLGFEVTRIPICTHESKLPSFRQNKTSQRIINYIYRV